MILGYDSHGAEVVEQTNEYKNIITFSMVL